MGKPSRLWDSVSRFLRRPRWQKFLLLESYIFLFGARVLVVALPFKYVSRLVGVKGESPSEKLASELPLQVRWSVTTASRYAFWNTLCLTQALAAKFMLNRRGLKSTLYLGTTRPSEGQFVAHAWVRCGDLIVTGEKGHEDYTVVACFA